MQTHTGLNRISLTPSSLLVFAILFLSILNLTAKSQYAIASRYDGCAPLKNVNFSISNTLLTDYVWDFGNGSNSTNAIASADFNFPGNYKVILRAKLAGVIITDTLMIKVHALPNPDFELHSSNTNCEGANVVFKRTGTASSQILGAYWSFGEGLEVNAFESTVAHQYNKQGNYSVGLKIIDINQCTAVLSKTDLVKISKKPSIKISTLNDKGEYCGIPANVLFNNDSKSNSINSDSLKFNWIFSNGLVSGQKLPTNFIIGQAGNYTCMLKVSDSDGCSDSIKLEVKTREMPLAKFAVNNIKANGVVCNPVTFKDLSQHGVSLFDFSPAQGAINGNVNYPSYGRYNVKLLVTNDFCKASAIETIVIDTIVADFELQNSYVCKLPQALKYIDKSLNALAWEWKFANGQLSNLKNPTIILNNAPQFTSDSLTVISKNACKQSIGKKSLKLDIPEASFTSSVTGGCAPLNVVFSDKSASIAKIKTYQWLAGDGNIGSGKLFSNLYNNTGNFMAKLIITTDSGCVDTSALISIKVGTKLLVDFSVSKNEVCLNDSVIFKDVSGVNEVESWRFISDRGLMTQCCNKSEVNWKMNSGLGKVDASLAITKNGCESSILKPELIEIIGTTGKFEIIQNCENTKLISLKIFETNANSISIDFGDGTQQSVSGNAVVDHLYTTAGEKEVKVIFSTINSSCAALELSKIITLSPLHVNFEMDSLVCISGNIFLDASASQFVPFSANNAYKWEFGGLANPIYSTAAKVNLPFPKGVTNYEVKLTIKDKNGCELSQIKSFVPNKLKAIIERDKLTGCMPLSVHFNDKSIVEDGTKYARNWSISGGSSYTESQFTHLFSGAVQRDANSNVLPFRIILLIKDSLACSSADTINIYPSEPLATFVHQGKSTICQGEEIVFEPNSKDSSAIFQWNFGNGILSDQRSPSVQFDSAGTYNVTLFVKDSLGCKAELVKTNYVLVSAKPEVGFVSTIDDLRACYPVLVKFSDTTSMNNTYKWSIKKDITNVFSGKEIVFDFIEPGTYQVTLEVQSVLACKNSITKDYIISGPWAKLKIDPPVICSNSEMEIKLIDTSSIGSFTVDLGDGLIVKDSLSFKHRLNYPKDKDSIAIQLFYESAVIGCPGSLITYVLPVNHIKADFNFKQSLDSVRCYGYEDSIYVSSIGADKYAWYFNGNYGGNEQSFKKTFLSGIQQIDLVVSNSNNSCADRVRKEILIHPKPVFLIPINPFYCEGTTVILSPNGGDKYEWKENDGITQYTKELNTIVKKDAYYTVNAISDKGCVNDSIFTLNVIDSVKSIDFDTLIFRGEFLEIGQIMPSLQHHFQWSNAPQINCSSCAITRVNTIESGVYFLKISDENACFENYSRFNVRINDKVNIGVPDAFSPNGDGVNELIYADGVGIRKLDSFKIYSREGKLLFESTDMEKGWDGFYNGALQASDTYIYNIIATGYLSTTPIEARGTFKLIR